MDAVRFCLGLLAVPWLVGCSDDGLDRVVVNGVVTYEGQVVQKGQIRFIPEQDTPGPLSIAEITNGNYRFDYQGGIPRGAHRVEILSFHPDDPPTIGPGSPSPRQLLPAKYNVNTELRVALPDSGREVTEDFALTR